MELKGVLDNVIPLWGVVCALGYISYSFIVMKVEMRYLRRDIKIIKKKLKIYEPDEEVEDEV